jgi:DNA-binding transcriptional ArsR family regulator
MLAFVPVAFDVYRPLKPRLRWAMQCLVSFADRAGQCFPSVRKLAAFAGLSKSAVSRHLRDLVEAGVISRKRRPGRGYQYEIDARFLPRSPVSHHRTEGVPRQAGQETEPEKQIERARRFARFAKLADRVKTRCLAATSVLRVTEDHERHCVTPRITPVSPRGDQIRPVSAIRSGTGGRASQPGAAFTAAINLPNATRLSTRLML